MSLCMLCDERNKKSRVYVNCAKVGGLVCMEHCNECQYHSYDLGIVRCACPDAENQFYRKRKEDLLKRVSPQSGYQGKP